MKKRRLAERSQTKLTLDMERPLGRRLNERRRSRSTSNLLSIEVREGDERGVTGVREGSVRGGTILSEQFLCASLYHGLVFVETEFTKKQNL